MADKDAKWEDNAPGKYYVDDNCVCTKYCVAAAPRNFAMSDEGHAYVSKQPETQEEEEQCQEAMRGCPPEAIGDDGADN